MNTKNDFGPTVLGLICGLSVAEIDLVLRIATFVFVGVPTGMYYFRKFQNEKLK